jgi:hypothetical protein
MQASKIKWTNFRFCDLASSLHQKRISFWGERIRHLVWRVGEIKWGDGGKGRGSSIQIFLACILRALPANIWTVRQITCIVGAENSKIDTRNFKISTTAMISVRLFVNEMGIIHADSAYALP